MSNNAIRILLGLTAGALLFAMIVANSILAAKTTATGASLIVHGLGSLALLPLLVKQWNLRSVVRRVKQTPKYLFTSGLFGALLVVTETQSVNSALSFSAAVSLFLLGQLVASAWIDQRFLGRPIDLRSLFSVATTFVGSCLVVIS